MTFPTSPRHRRPTVVIMMVMLAIYLVITLFKMDSESHQPDVSSIFSETRQHHMMKRELPQEAGLDSVQDVLEEAPPTPPIPQQPHGYTYKSTSLQSLVRTALDSNSEWQCQENMLRFIIANSKTGLCLDCPDREPTNSGGNPTGTVCQRYRDEGQMERQAYVNFFGSNLTAAESEEKMGLVTFVSQLSVNRFERIEVIAQHWKGSMSLAIYLHPSEIYNLLLMKMCQNPLLRSRTNIFYHLSFYQGDYYPVNFLRNVALDGAPTPYVFLSDIDLIPSMALDQYLARKITMNLLPPSTAWILAAFEMVQLPYSPTNFPQDKDALMRMVKEGHLIPFLEQFYAPAYNATDYPAWFAASDTYQIAYQEEFEPYIVMRKSEVPRYDVRLIGRIRDKVSHLLEVHLTGVTLAVLPDVYTLHYPHGGREKSIQIAKDYYQCSVALFNDIIEELIIKYPLRLKELLNYEFRFFPKPRAPPSPRRRWMRIR